MPKVGLMLHPGVMLPVMLPGSSDATMASSAVPLMPPGTFISQEYHSPDSRYGNSASVKEASKFRSRSHRSGGMLDTQDAWARSQELAHMQRDVCINRPSFGSLHHFHEETQGTGVLSEDRRTFTKTMFKGRLSLITESEVHSSGVHRYSMQFTSGELSSADGLGFVFSPTLPCPKNIQRIVSIFVNRAGRICMRAQNEVRRSDIGIKMLELGDWISLVMDLEEQTATFAVYPKCGARPSTAVFPYGDVLEQLRQRLPRGNMIKAVGHFACVIKNDNVQVVLGS
jgi:hypothetical protein